MSDNLLPICCCQFGRNWLQGWPIPTQKFIYTSADSELGFALQSIGHLTGNPQTFFFIFFSLYISMFLFALQQMTTRLQSIDGGHGSVKFILHLHLLAWHINLSLIIFRFLSPQHSNHPHYSIHSYFT